MPISGPSAGGEFLLLPLFLPLSIIAMQRMSLKRGTSGHTMPQAAKSLRRRAAYLSHSLRTLGLRGSGAVAMRRVGVVGKGARFRALKLAGGLKRLRLSL